MIPKRLLSLLLLALLVFPAYLGISAGGNRYKVAACDWMMLKRQKLGSFKLMHELGGDGVEMDMGGLGVRDTFDNKFHHRHFRKLFRETADSLGVLVPSVAMSGFYGQSFLTHHNYKALVEDCLSTMRVMDSKVAYLPLGGIKEDWTKPGPARDELVKRLHVAGVMAEADGLVIGIRTPLDAKENIRLLKEIDSPGIKIYYSFQTALDNHRDIISELKTLGKDRICQIHASNTDGVTLDRDTALDMPKIKETLDKMGWSGWLVVERSRDVKEVRNVKKNFGTNIRYLKEVFQK
ncbi:TIM barrel protein [Duncaniella freteri]|jgi:sugar phosphate isomerase/epimerase|uniref:Sugar phosphate isomerase/epimerase n=4 Tax=Duncaniella TaxID=2518495 RepID=A0A4Z0VAN5_9BACT|nr:TIM barrel protein [Duncaniella freteri]MDE7028061.1 sugar phosphate isomerase/epimerase [Duncaniella freteri]TGG40608.1 sugar phosphate isomerase/epimerase [Duncaniella freteri]